MTLATSEVNDHAILLVSTPNRSWAAVNLGTENVTATLGGSRLHVFSARELTRNEKIANVFAHIGAGVQAGARSYAASQPIRTGYGGNVYVAGAGPLPMASYSGTATTYDPARAGLAQAPSTPTPRRRWPSSTRRPPRAWERSGTVLQTTTVPPGGAAGGIVEINSMGMGAMVSVHLDFVGDEHVFNFRRSREENEFEAHPPSPGKRATPGAGIATHGTPATFGELRATGGPGAAMSVADFFVGVKAASARGSATERARMASGSSPEGSAPATGGLPLPGTSALNNVGR